MPLFQQTMHQHPNNPSQNLEDSFLWDDGWDDPHSLWEFDKERFPERFDEVSKRARDYGAGTGVWLSPWGGYGFTQDGKFDIFIQQKNGGNDLREVFLTKASFIFFFVKKQQHALRFPAGVGR